MLLNNLINIIMKNKEQILLEINHLWILLNSNFGRFGTSKNTMYDNLILNKINNLYQEYNNERN